MRLNYAIVFVSNMDRSVSFYRDLLGLPLKFESSHWTEFSTDGATVALHLSDEPAPIASDAAQSVAGQCRPGLSVPDLDEFHRKMLEQNVRCVQAPKDSFGAKVAQYVDPDGLVVSVSEQRGNR